MLGQELLQSYRGFKTFAENHKLGGRGGEGGGEGVLTNGSS